LHTNRIIRSAGTIGALTLLSRCFGLLRDILIAYHFGTGLLASAFFTAFTLPNLFRRLFGEGALSAAFIPLFIQTRQTDGSPAAWQLAQRVGTLLTLTLTLLTLLGIGLLTLLMQNQLLSPTWHTTLNLARIMLPYLIFICLAALSMGLLNAHNHYTLPALAPTLLNLTLIATMTLLFPRLTCPPDQIHALAYTVLLAGILQLIIQLPALKSRGARFTPTPFRHDPRVKKMLHLMAPAALGVAVTQFNVVIDRLLALSIGDWAPAALFYSERMIYFPLGLIATALGTVLLPTFSQQAARSDRAAITQSLANALRHMLYIMIPAAIGLLWLSTPVLNVLFNWQGAFDSHSTQLAARALAFYTPGLIIFSAAKLLVPAFYALQDTRTPVRIGLITVALNLLLNLLAIALLPTYWKHAGLAAATVLSETAGILLLTRALHHKLPPLPLKQLLNTATHALFRALLMGLAIGTLYNTLTLLLPPTTKLAQLTTLLLTILSGILFYLLISRSRPEQQTLLRALKKSPH
tara:strand:- start:6241 stop:7806 length:1566 start_codon:yes stop_codon:yes gene_type:complete